MSTFLSRLRVKPMLLGLACFLAFFGCGSRSKSSSDKVARQSISKPEDLNRPGRTIAGMSEIFATKEAKKALPQASYLELPLPTDCYLALESKKVDAVVYDRPALEYAMCFRKEFVVLPDDIALGHISVGLSKSQPELLKQVNAFIRQIKQDGTYQKMRGRWIQSREPKMPEIAPPKSPDGTLVVGLDVLNPPMTYLEHGKPVGYDVEFSLRLGVFLNKKIEFRTIAYEGLIAALESGKIDLAIAQMDATPEREESIAFTDEYIDSAVALMIRKGDYDTPYATLADLKDLTIGTLKGSMFVQHSRDYMPYHEAKAYAKFSEMVYALERKEIDAFYVDSLLVRFVLNLHPDFTVVPQKMPGANYGFIFPKNNQAFCDVVSDEIRNMKKNGTLEKLKQAWFAKDETNKVLEKPIDSNRTLKLCVFTNSEPFAYVKNGQITGYEVAIATMVANKLGYRLVIEKCEFQDLIENVATGKADFACGMISNTPERRKKVLFSDATGEGGISLIVRKEKQADEKKKTFSQWTRQFMASTAESFSKTFIREHRWKLILQGLGITLVITICSVILGTILALPLCLMCMSKNRFGSSLGKHFISLIMGTPLLVVLMILYYVIFAKVDISGIIVAVIAFAIDFAVYTSVTLQSGIEGIPKGQMEAALVLGHKPTAAFFRYILPQAIRSILPVYTSEIISTLKSTSIVGYIAIMDLTKIGDIIRSRTYEAFFPLIAIAVIYFLIAKILSALLHAIEYRINPVTRRNRLVKGAEK